MSASIASPENGATSPPASAHNPADPASRLQSSGWRTTQLPRLQGLPLLPVGAGRDGKAPADPSKPATAASRGLDGWSTAAWAPAAIAATLPDRVTACGMRWGPDADGLVCFDLDGEAALELAAAAGCEVFTDATWSIHRHTAPDRLKIVWRVPPEQWPAPDDRRYGTATLRTTDGGEVRAFWSTGQAVVAGLHRPSDAYLEWVGGPEAIGTLPAPWMTLWRSLEAGNGDRPTRLHRGSSKADWSPAVPCPICGRRKDADCQQHKDGAVLCHHGANHAPPSGLRIGEIITGNWAFCGERQNAIGRCSLFRQHQPRPRPVVLDDPGQSPPSVLDNPGQSRPVVLDDPGQENTDRPRRQKVAVDEVLKLLPGRLGSLRLNVRSGDVVSSRRGVLSANEISRLYLELSTEQERWAKEPTADGVTLLASRNRFDPVWEYIDGITVPPLPLEQWKRLDKYLLGIDDPIAASFLPRYLVSAVARTYQPGCYVRQMPVLIGDQEIGKSALGRILFGGVHWVEGVDALDRDALMKCGTAWGIELAELDGITRRRDQEQLKAFLTETADTYRRPYDRAPERHPRRFVFWATANRPPLRDPSGSTRFVGILLPGRLLPLDWATASRDAIWARAVEQYRAGVNWERAGDDERAAVAERNADLVADHDPWGEMVKAYLAHRHTSGELPVKTAELLLHLRVTTEHQTTAAARRVREIAEGVGWWHGRRRQAGGEPRQGLWPPA